MAMYNWPPCTVGVDERCTDGRQPADRGGLRGAAPVRAHEGDPGHPAGRLQADNR